MTDFDGTRESRISGFDTSGGVFNRPEAITSNCFSFLWIDNFWRFCEVILLEQRKLLATFHWSGDSKS